MPYHEADRLLVEGELVVSTEGTETRVWLSQRDVAKRFDVAPSLVAAFAKQHRCVERKAAFQAGKIIEPITLKEKESAPVVAEPQAVPAVAAESTPVSVPSEPKRKPGRPRKAEAPLISYEELDRLLVFGEVNVLENGATTTVYPSYRQLAERYGVAPSVIASYAKSHNCLRRREETTTRVAIRTEDKLIELRAEAIAVGEDRLVKMIDNFLLSFEKALEEGRVRSDNPTDVNTLARLKAFILGGADSRQEVRAILSLDSLQERYARMLRDQREATGDMAGVIDVQGVTVAKTEQANPNTEARAPDRSVLADEPPPPPNEALARESNEMLTSEVRDLVRLARTLALAMDAEDSEDDALIEVQLLRAVERIEQRLGVVSPRGSADVGSRRADGQEDGA
jgi:hypothetical protein